MRMADFENQVWKNKCNEHPPGYQQQQSLKLRSQKETPFLTLRVLEGTGMCSRAVAGQQEEELRFPDLRIFLRCFPEGSFVDRAHYQETGLILNLVECSRMKI